MRAQFGFSGKRKPTKHDFHQASVFGPRFQHTLLQQSKEPQKLLILLFLNTYHTVLQQAESQMNLRTYREHNYYTGHEKEILLNMFT